MTNSAPLMKAASSDVATWPAIDEMMIEAAVSQVRYAAPVFIAAIAARQQ